MRRVILTTLTFVTSLSVFAYHPSYSEKEFCAARKKADYVKSLTKEESNLMSFRNHGGLVNGGVCWWHSRFQRNALYLTIFKPELPKPTIEEARDLIKQIRYAKNVVVIPGYSDFTNFSYDFEGQIQRELEKWQKGDGFVRMAWVKGLEGSSEVKPEELRALMDQIYHEVKENNNISFNKLQMPGAIAHAWLVVDMEKTKDGYILKVLDSNYPRELQTYEYEDGDTSFDYHGYYRFVPYLERLDEMVQIRDVIRNFCDK